MKKSKFTLNNNLKNILIIVLVIIIIGIAITCRLIWKYHFIATPSQADLKYGLEDTFTQVDKLECKYYDKIKYSKLTYKYTCSFEYKNTDNEVNNAKTCVDCVIKGKKWQCSISTSECFR